MNDKKLNPFISYSFLVIVVLFVLSVYFPDLISPYIAIKPEELTTILLILFIIIMLGGAYEPYKDEIKENFLTEKPKESDLSNFLLYKFKTIGIFSYPPKKVLNCEHSRTLETVLTVYFFENDFIISGFGNMRKFDYNKDFLELGKAKFIKYLTVKFDNKELSFLLSQNAYKLMESKLENENLY